MSTTQRRPHAPMVTLITGGRVCATILSRAQAGPHWFGFEWLSPRGQDNEGSPGGGGSNPPPNTEGVGSDPPIHLETVRVRVEIFVSLVKGLDGSQAKIMGKMEIPHSLKINFKNPHFSEFLYFSQVVTPRQQNNAKRFKMRGEIKIPSAQRWKIFFLLF